MVMKNAYHRRQTRFFLLLLFSVVISGCVVYSTPPPSGTTVVETPPPAQTEIVIYEPPPLIRIERTNIQWCQYKDYDIYYVDGYYYVYKYGAWYRSTHYRGPWVRITVLPEVFWEIPATHPRYDIVIRYTPEKKGPPPHAKPSEPRDTHPRRIER